MHPLGGYRYAASIPAAGAASSSRAAGLSEGPHEYVISIFRGDSVTTFPSGIRGKPVDWDYYGRAAWKLNIVSPRTPLLLFDPAPDASRLAFTRIGDAGRRGLFRLGVSDATGKTIFHLALPVDASGWSPPDYTASLGIDDRIRARLGALADATALQMRVRGLGPRQTLHVTLMEDDGTSWTARVSLDSTWQDATVPVSTFAIARGVLLPQGFPGEWSYWVGPAAGRGTSGDRPRLDHVERIQFSLRPEAGLAVKPESSGVEVEWVTLR
jgi:hypothetical protein